MSRAHSGTDTSAHKRLLIDYKEVSTAEHLTGITAAPLSDNLFEWHANLFLGGDEDQYVTPLHLILTFTHLYPKVPPKIKCCSPFPHANVERNLTGLSICLDMLETPSSSDSTPYAGWSSAMSVLSILVQLQSFLSDRRMHYADGMGTMLRAKEIMATYECTVPGCTHHGSKAPWPPLNAVNAKVAKRIVCRPCGSFTTTTGGEESDEASALALVERFPLPGNPQNKAAPPTRSKKSGLITTYNHFEKLADAPSDPIAPSEPPTKAPTIPALPTSMSAPAKAITTHANLATTPSASAAVPLKELSTSPPVTTCKPPVLTKAQKKNMARGVRRHSAKLNDKLLSSHTAKSESQATPTGVARLSIGSEAPTVQDTDALSTLSLASDNVVEGASGPFAILGYDALIILFEHLDRDSAMSLACTCKSLATTGQDGLLWRSLFSKHYPSSSLSAASMSEWKHCFMLELTATTDQLTCFHSKVALGAEDGGGRGGPEVFGLPITFTVNPRTSEVDYVYSPMDLLSYTAFATDEVRRSVWNEKFTHFLPLYLTADHFQAALPQLRRTLLSMCGNAPSWRHARGRFVPEMALDVLPKLLCTMVVLLMDRGVAASDRIIDGYVQVNRLLLAVVEAYPELRRAVTRRVQNFIKDERARNKRAEPSLGVLVPLLSIASGLRWSELAWPLLEESFDRGVLWACRDHPALEKVDVVSDEDRLQLNWASRRVSSRLLMFHYGFLSRLAKLSTSELDQFYGGATPWLRASLRAHTASVLAVDSWPGFFEHMNVPLPPKAYMADWLKRCVVNSARKRYHTPGMDFSRVQRSGVSKILRKGESVSCNPTMRRIRLEQVWRWRGAHTIFLDASCLTYGFDGQHFADVDYANRVSVSGLAQSGHGVSGRNGDMAIRHSGDVVDGDRRQGTHTINMSLRQLSDKVGALYLTLSAWTTTLSEIIRPEIKCFDPDDTSGEPLARYELDGKPTGEFTAVVMARIWRERPGSRWNVTAIGELGMGRAGSYKQIYDKISDCGERAEASKAMRVVS